MARLIDKIVPAEDKLKHDYIGGWLSLIFIPCLVVGWQSWTALAVCVLIAIGWEVYQKIAGSGKFEVVDAFFTIRIPLTVFIITII